MPYCADTLLTASSPARTRVQAFRLRRNLGARRNSLPPRKSHPPAGLPQMPAFAGNSGRRCKEHSGNTGERTGRRIALTHSSPLLRPRECAFKRFGSAETLAQGGIHFRRASPIRLQGSRKCITFAGNSGRRCQEHSGNTGEGTGRRTALIWQLLTLSNITHAQFLNRDKESQKSLTARGKACIIPACSLQDVCPVRKVESMW